MKRILASVFAIVFPAVCWAQGQSAHPTGTFTPGHALRANTSSGSPYSDAGGAAGSSILGSGYLTELGITNTGMPFCINDRLISDIRGYHRLCFGHTTAGSGLIAVDSLGSATVESLGFSINGVIVPFPGAVSGLPTVLSNAELKLLPSTYATLVVRLDTIPGYGAPPTFYSPSATPCSLEVNGDDGAQVPTSDGGCWNMRTPASGVYNVKIWPAKVDGVTDDSAAERAANRAITTLYGGGTILVPPTGYCMEGQNFTAGDARLGAGVMLKGGALGACMQLIANAVHPLFQTTNANVFMHRTITGTVTSASSSIPVTDTAELASGLAIILIDNTGNAHTAIINGTPSPTSIPVNAGTWSPAGFTASAGSWIAPFDYPGPPNTGIEDMLLDGNLAHQPPVNNNVVNAQTLGGAGNLTLASAAPTFKPGSNLLLEFYSLGDLSSVTFTISCELSRLDYTRASLTLTRTGPNNSIVRTSTGCNKVTNIAANGAVTSPLTVGAADGETSLDGVIHYGPMPRYRNVIAENFRGWPFHFGFGPGVGFYSPAPSHQFQSNWQTQEAYLQNLQCLTAHAGCLWFDGPNDSRIDSVTANFITGYGVLFDRMGAGSNGFDFHISGGFPDGITEVSPLYGIATYTDGITCIGCKSQEAGTDIGIFGNNSVFTGFEVFHVDDTVDHAGIQIGDINYTPATNLVKQYVLEGRSQNEGQGAVKFVKDGGWGRIRILGFDSGAFAGKPAYQGAPWGCNDLNNPGSDIDINIVGASATAPVNPLRIPGPCPTWTPSLKFDGVAPAQTAEGEWQGNIAQFRVTLGATPATGLVTITGMPWAPVQDCPVQVTYMTTGSGLSGTLNGRMFGNVIELQEWGVAGTADLTQTTDPFNNGTVFRGTVGPCIRG